MDNLKKDDGQRSNASIVLRLFRKVELAISGDPAGLNKVIILAALGAVVYILSRVLTAFGM